MHLTSSGSRLTIFIEESQWGQVKISAGSKESPSRVKFAAHSGHLIFKATIVSPFTTGVVLVYSQIESDLFVKR